jgi:hypothetical protein
MDVSSQFYDPAASRSEDKTQRLSRPLGQSNRSEKSKKKRKNFHFSK